MHSHDYREAFSIRGKMPRSLDFMLGMIALGIAFVVWIIVTSGPSPDKRMIRPSFLPSPRDIVMGAILLIKQGTLINDILVSLERIWTAMLITTAVGVPIGILMGGLPFVDSLFRKFLDGGKSIPPTAFIGLIILWAGIEERSKILFLFLGAIFYMILMTKNAILNVREEYITVARDIGATTPQIIMKVLLPGALPQIWDAIIVCTGLMWTYIVLAEFQNANSGLGYLIAISGRLSQSDRVFVGIIVIALVSATTDWLLRLVRKRFFNW
jgi:NitT/TauT family transport system permease protein